MSKPPPLEERFSARMAALGVRPGDRVLLALSGGADSVVLLHLLRFGGFARGLTAAHFDHSMRPGSAQDAAWVRGLCRAWAVPCATGHAAVELRAEAEARDARYAFLREEQRRAGAAFLATAHHADDQAETVLMRLARGTGLTGLGGIPEAGGGGLIRPLLACARPELRAYARAHAIRWREDPTNQGALPLRNRVRHLLLPRLEAASPGLTRRLAELAGAAREVDARLDARAARALTASSTAEGDDLLLEREALRVYDSPFASRMLRLALRRFGTTLDRPGTRTALQFISSATSGAEVTLPGGRVRLLIEFGMVRLQPAGRAPLEVETPLEVSGSGGAGEAVVGGRRVVVRWRTGAPQPNEVAVAPERAPLLVRGWLPGDRIRTPAGSRTLKKLFNDARVPRSRRLRTPVVADAAGRVVWVAGIAREAEAPREPALILSILDA